MRFGKELDREIVEHYGDSVAIFSLQAAKCASNFSVGKELRREIAGRPWQTQCGSARLVMTGQSSGRTQLGHEQGRSRAANLQRLWRSANNLPGWHVFLEGKDPKSMSMMWKSSQAPLAVAKSAPEPLRFESGAPANEYGSRSIVPPVVVEQASIARGMVFNGSITGTNSLFVDGEVVGSIHLPDGRVTVGPTGHVSDGLSVCIRAREIVVMGKVRGNIAATDRVEICAEGHLTGNVSAARISIADGAYFRGDIDLRTAQSKPAVSYAQKEEEQRKAYA